MRLLFLFLDGIGLASVHPETNPLAIADMPALRALLEGRQLTKEAVNIVSPHASLISLDACLGISGLPQSATGQAALLTGQNVPAQVGYHYGPKPNKAIAKIITEGNIFSRLKKAGKSVALLNAYPPRYFQSLAAGRRIYSTIPLAITNAEVALKTQADLEAGAALSADFSGHGWHTELGIDAIPEITPEQAGERIVQLTKQVDLAFFEYWLTDIAGHKQNKENALFLLNTVDNVLRGILNTWEFDKGLILITSDHGNLEDLSTRHHTTNPVPALVIGPPEMRKRFCQALHNLTDISPAIMNLLLR